MSNSPSIQIQQSIECGKKSAAYIAQERRLVSIQQGFGAALATVWLLASKSTLLASNSLSLAFVHDAIQSMAAITCLASNGMYSPAKRELRYFLESAAKHAFVDLNQRHGNLSERIAYLDKEVPSSSIEFIKTQPLLGLSHEDAADFKSSATSQYKRLCAYAHRSPTQLRQELRNMNSGLREPKITAKQLEKFNRECFNVYDIAVILQSQVLLMEFGGNGLLNALREVHHWPFHRGKFTRKLFQHYRFESQNHCEKLSFG